MFRCEAEQDNAVAAIHGVLTGIRHERSNDRRSGAFAEARLGYAANRGGREGTGAMTERATVEADSGGGGAGSMLRVATWNINGMRARFDFLVHWLRARRPDVVGLQELKMPEDAVPRRELEQLGYAVEACSEKSWNGVAVLSRLPIEVVQSGLPGGEEHGARLLTVRTAGLLFTTVYCPNGKSVEHDDFSRKLEWFDRLAEHLAESRDPHEPYVLAGDFNICRRGVDSWDAARFEGRIFHTAEERRRLDALIDWGLEDLYRSRGPDDGAFSWWDYRGGAFHRNQGLRIDLLLGTRAVGERTRDVTIDRDYRKKKDGLVASDHAPVLADLVRLE
ncbi:MAG: exodeoxyribonuclease III [Acidobacteria bacterium]|nr:MAG: exodeoxyribonuclease III [Acidobacteriota bacterium]REK00169.1 MAG: exodeoxyribonuclease III [Acidobacteriota bacterium]